MPYVDSCGLGAMAQEYISARRGGGDLKLLHVTGRNLHLLRLTKLVTVFESFDSEDEAARSFSRPVHVDLAGGASCFAEDAVVS